jgi:hypothetical protein
MPRVHSAKAVPLDAMPWPWPIPVAEPGLVACPVAPSGGWSAAQEMYLLAYERAVASARPSRYAMARYGSPN